MYGLSSFTDPLRVVKCEGGFQDSSSMSTHYQASSLVRIRYIRMHCPFPRYSDLRLRWPTECTRIERETDACRGR